MEYFLISWDFFPFIFYFSLIFTPFPDSPTKHQQTDGRNPASGDPYRDPCPVFPQRNNQCSNKSNQDKYSTDMPTSARTPPPARTMCTVQKAMLTSRSNDRLHCLNRNQNAYHHNSQGAERRNPASHNRPSRNTGHKARTFNKKEPHCN